MLFRSQLKLHHTLFTGIIESTGIVKQIEKDRNNLNFWLECDFTNELKIDQSIAHNGVCMTVVEIKDKLYKVTAIDETLKKTNLGQLSIGKKRSEERRVGKECRSKRRRCAYRKEE